MTRPARLVYTSIVRLAEAARSLDDQGENIAALDKLTELQQMTNRAVVDLRDFLYGDRVVKAVEAFRQLGNPLARLLCGAEHVEAGNVKRRCVLHPHRGDWHRGPDGVCWGVEATAAAGGEGGGGVSGETVADSILRLVAELERERERSRALRNDLEREIDNNRKGG